MRKLLATAAAIAPLMVASGVQAEVVVSTTRTTPIVTSTATGTTADDVRLAAGGSVQLTSGAAVTVDSNNSIDLDSGSSVTMNNTASNSTGILVNGGTTGAVTVGGAVSLNDNIATPVDADNDGDADGPFANGTARYGVRLLGAHTGAITTEAGANIAIEGNDSYALSIEGPQTGDVTLVGAMSTLGDNVVTLSNTGTIAGNVLISAGAITATGLNATGVSIDGTITGLLHVQTAISSTGYRYTTPPPVLPTGVTNGSTLYLVDLDADDLLQGGSAVRIRAGVSGGVLFDNPSTTITSVLTTYGGAPALSIGSTTSAINLGLVGTGTSAYGLINRGTINGYGVYTGVQAQGAQIGVAGGQAVTIAGGISNPGTIGAQSLNGSATGLNLLSGASTPTLINGGTILGQAISTLSTTPATGLLIQAGASLPSINNDGIIGGLVTGTASNAYGVRDLSGTVTSIINTGTISGVVNAGTGVAVTGATVALDLTANTTGTTITQFGIASAATATDPDTDGDGVTNSNEPLTQGNILLGSGADTLNIQNGQVLGAIAFGNGADTLNITGGASVVGALSDTDGQLNINVTNGSLAAQQTAPLNVTGLTVGASGSLLVTVNPTSGTSAGFNVNGTATLANGASLGVQFASLLQTPQQFTVIHANTLNYGTINAASLQTNSPYLYVVSASANVPAGDVYINARRRTAAEAGLIPVEAAAYDAVYAGLSANTALQTAFLSETTRAGLMNLFEQTLPDHSGGPLMSLSSGVDAVTRALTERNASTGVGEVSAWTQEINFYADKDKTDTYGYRSEGFGVAGGVEKGTTLGAVGVSLAFTSSDIKDPEAEAQEVLSANLVELGLYWRAQGENWTTWARAAGGYATFSATRTLVGDGLYLSNTSSWNGFTLALAGGGSYERHFGRINVRPEAYAEYFSLHEGDRVEAGGGNGFDLDINSRDGHALSAIAAVNVGYGFGENGWIRPEFRLGWRQNISVDLGETIARYASGGSPYTLSPASMEGGGPIAGFRLAVGNDLGKLSISADAEKLEDYVRLSLLLRASFRF